MTNSEIIESIRLKYSGIYDGDEINILTKKIENMSPVVKKSLTVFLETGSCLELNLFGYSVNKLVEEHHMNEIAAHFTLDWIVRDPDEALKSLGKGSDVVGKLV